MAKFRVRFPYLYIAFGFFALILAGSLLLILPVSTKQGISYVDAFFVSVSAVCITGLSPVVLESTFTVFGKAVVLLLIQLGGLGFVTVAVSVFSMLGFRLGLSEKFLLEETLGNSASINYKKLFRRVLLITGGMELFGTVVNLIALSGDYSGWKLVGYALFHAVSAFNNAGFDLIGSQSFIPCADNILFLINTAFLTICGGLGCLVINDVFTAHCWRKFSVHTKVVLVITPVLLLVWTLGIFFSEWGNIGCDHAFFMSAMTRTCGFSTEDLTQWNNATLLLIDFLMFIGAAPMSTAGGIKCTTFFVILASVAAFVRGKRPTAFRRYLTRDLVFRSLLIATIGFAIVFCTGTAVCAADPEAPFAWVVTEVISAFANVGLSASLTPTLSAWSKLFLCFAMFLGRIGCLTMLLIMRGRAKNDENDGIRFAAAQISVG